MKKYIFYSFSLLIFFTPACKKSEACLNASSSTVKVGQEITFNDCSTHSSKSKIDFGNGIEQEIQGSIIYSYPDPGSYNARIKVYNKKGDKKDEATKTITVENPTESELAGTWTLTTEVDNSAGSKDSTNMNETWVFNPDRSGTRTDNSGNTSNFTWELDNNTLYISNDQYHLTKLYNGQMEWRYDEMNMMYLGYMYKTYNFTKKSNI